MSARRLQPRGATQHGQHVTYRAFTTMRNNRSCWICRVRHKKCDETHPSCTNCTALGLSCLYGSHKPEWMDNGQLQRRMGQRLKALVKRNARNRRGRQKIDRIHRDIADAHCSPTATPHSDLTTSISESTDGTTPTPHGHGSSSKRTPTSEPGVNNTENLALPETFNGSFLGLDRCQEPLTIRREEDLRILMIYKDYIFPLLYPFYHPSIFEGGHTWLLVSAMRNQESCQLMLSLATYFFSVIPIFPGQGLQLCSTFAWCEVQRHTDEAFKGMQQRVEAFGRRGVSETLSESMYLLGDIMLLLQCETMMQSCEAWTVHLDAAIILFEQILASPQLDSVVWRVPFDPENMSVEIASNLTPAQAQIFLSSQVAFRFFAANIIIADVVSSTALEQRPRLREHHKRLICGPEATSLSLSLSDVTGCENWVYAAVSDIVELEVWKKQTKKAATFSLMTLVQRASKITGKLELGLAGLADDAPDTESGQKSIFAWRSACPPRHAYNTITHIWANSAKLYLHIVLSGWQPENREILELVVANLALFQTLALPSWLSSLAWPFCLTGCLATQSQQVIFRQLYEATEHLGRIGGLSEAVKIMEAMWKRRGEINPETWDTAACFQILDRVPLLL
ncbi:hypothetical protein F66182_4398 [Fusarium sp. NRRL 66182]|nr:hypothetical protein F66182_4398 [Fusarium sp. NRRL 66182]